MNADVFEGICRDQDMLTTLLASSPTMPPGYRRCGYKQLEQRLKLLFTYDEAAAALGMTRAALRDLVYKRRGPVVTKIGRRTFFALADLEAFVAAHRVPASQVPVQARAPRRKRGRPTIVEQMQSRSVYLH